MQIGMRDCTAEHFPRHRGDRVWLGHDVRVGVAVAVVRVLVLVDEHSLHGRSRRRRLLLFLANRPGVLEAIV